MYLRFISVTFISAVRAQLRTSRLTTWHIRALQDSMRLQTVFWQNV